MAPETTAGSGAELHLRSSEGGGSNDERNVRVVLLAVSERLGVCVVPLLRGRLDNPGSGGLEKKTRQIAEAIKRSPEVAQFNRADVQGPSDESLPKVPFGSLQGTGPLTPVFQR